MVLLYFQVLYKETNLKIVHKKSKLNKIKQNKTKTFKMEFNNQLKRWDEECGIISSLIEKTITLVKTDFT